MVRGVTLKRFFILHFLLPFVLAGLRLGHVAVLHTRGGSSNPLGLQWEHRAIPFHPYYRSKDMVGLAVMYGGMLLQVIWFPDFFLEELNFHVIDPMKTPLGIKPEWYFLFLYCVLRAIPYKTAGILIMFGCLGMLAVLPYIHIGRYRRITYYPMCQFIF